MKLFIPTERFGRVVYLINVLHCEKRNKGNSEGVQDEVKKNRDGFALF